MRSIGITFVLLALLSPLTSNAQLSLRLDPEQGQFGAGPSSSCVDLTESFGSTSIPSRSVIGPVIKFNNLHLAWASDDALYINSIRVVVSGTGIQGGQQIIQVEGDEMDALLALNYPRVLQGPIIVDSSDTARGKEVPACPFVIGTIAMDPFGPSFIADVRVEVIGTAVNKSGDESFIKAAVSSQIPY